MVATLSYYKIEMMELSFRGWCFVETNVNTFVQLGFKSIISREMWVIFIAPTTVDPNHGWIPHNKVLIQGCQSSLWLSRKLVQDPGVLFFNVQ
jgi:hypothetical protein